MTEQNFIAEAATGDYSAAQIMGAIRVDGKHSWGDVGSVAGPMWRSEAEHAAATWPGELVSREVTYGEWTAATNTSAAAGPTKAAMAGDEWA